MKQQLDRFLRAHPPVRFAADVVDADPFLPEGVLRLFQDYLTYIDTNQSSAMLLSGVFLTVLFASAAVRGLMNIMAELYGRSTFRGIGQLIASILFSILLLSTIYLSLAVVVTGNWFFHLLGQVLRLEDLVERFGTWQWVKYLLLLGMVFLFILLLYRFAAPLDKPAERTTKRGSRGATAMAASAALAIASMVFSLLMGNSARYSLIYGSLASVILLLVWLYLCGNILIMGNAVNYVPKGSAAIGAHKIRFPAHTIPRQVHTEREMVLLCGRSACGSGTRAWRTG